MKYQVHWKHHQLKEHTVHGIYDNLESALQSIYDWWKLNEFEPPYVRYWTKNGETTVDYGYHHIFYYIYEIKEESN